MPDVSLPSSARALLDAQSGVATIDQLVSCDVSPWQIRAHVAAKRWRRVGDRCVLTHNFEATRQQWMWIAVLDNRGPAALAGLTALEWRGFRFFGAEMEQVHVVVPRGAAYHRFPGVKVHESRRLSTADVLRTGGPPRLPVPRSAVDAAAWQPNPRYASGVLAAVVQQRLCTADDLALVLPTVGRVRHKQVMRVTIADIRGGAEALSELDVAAMCRRFGIRPPDRQRIRRDRQGRKRYLDCEWRLSDGSVVVLEIDGAHHLQVEHWESDMKRERSVVISGRTVLRCTANEARYEQAELASDLAAVGIPTELSERRSAIAQRRSDNSVR